MISDDDLRRLLTVPEADHVERTSSVRDRDKLAEAICAFANDLPDRRVPGCLIIGVHNDGSCANLAIDDELLRSLGGFRSDGTITPFPVLTVERRVLDGCTLAIVEVHPSENPPVRFNGRTCIRIGPRRGYATADEERRLIEKRRWGHCRSISSLLPERRSAISICSGFGRSIFRPPCTPMFWQRTGAMSAINCWRYDCSIAAGH